MDDILGTHSIECLLLGKTVPQAMSGTLACD
jgi:hypothetical protein